MDVTKGALIGGITVGTVIFIWGISKLLRPTYYHSKIVPSLQKKLSSNSSHLYEVTIIVRYPTELDHCDHTMQVKDMMTEVSNLGLLVTNHLLFSREAGIVARGNTNSIQKVAQLDYVVSISEHATAHACTN